MHIYLVRHTVYSNPENVYAFHLPMNLSPEGREHAQRIGQWFAKNTPPKLPIFTSPIVRAVQTAELIARSTDSFVQTDARLIETHCPGLQGVKSTGNEPWTLEEDDPTREPRQSILDRAKSIFQEKITAGEDCVLVAHGDVLTILYYHLQQKEMPQYMWGPDNEENIIKKGEIVEIEVLDKQVSGVRKFSK